MVSNFKSIVSSVIGPRKSEVEKNVYKHEQILADIERKLDREEIRTKAEAMQALESQFGYHLTKDDYRRIDKELGYKIK